jgi:hypothetical protein
LVVVLGQQVSEIEDPIKFSKYFGCQRPTIKKLEELVAARADMDP